MSPPWIMVDDTNPGTGLVRSLRACSTVSKNLIAHNKVHFCQFNLGDVGLQVPLCRGRLGPLQSDME